MEVLYLRWVSFDGRLVMGCLRGDVNKRAWKRVDRSAESIAKRDW